MMDEEVLVQLRNIVGKNRVLTRGNELYTYSFDATPIVQAQPDVVVMPGDTREVAEILKLAHVNQIPVIPRGSGTNLAGGTVPVEGGIVLNMTRFNKILEIDEKNLTATVGPGVITAEFHKAVEECGFFYPPDPGSMRISTIGGNVAQCAGGMRGLKYGVTKDYVMGLEYVLPTGQILRCGGKNYKDVAGYDLTRLLVGSEGTLAVITEITLKLLPRPETKRTLVVFCHQMVDAARIVERTIAEKIIPATMEFLDQATMQVVDDFSHLGLPRNVAAMLLLEQDGSEEQVVRDVDRIAEIAREEGVADVQLAKTAEEGAKLMAARRSALAALSRLRPTTILEDATVPRSQLAQMVEAIIQISAKHQVQICTFGHAGDGNLHPTCMTDERNHEEIKRVEEAFREIFATALALGGTITGEHGVGMAKMAYLPQRVGEGGIELMQAIKQAFDPHGIMNPGKVVAKAARSRVVVRNA
ncbi:FAD-binding oxidoreductase [Alicyclobacillus dauci]|uniref:FAD-binding protein n=1 Tax=Alicyclobacillus dauci TaxID=1475485 RepID=A0ABY6Z8N4_9BACL|nr:FAD-linked oxidase C-terminal domain-containing protein [Alicyclobacillus dauci]WAH39088.1 FAD-binding protein [Alicyclobacillus dauci]